MGIYRPRRASRVAQTEAGVPAKGEHDLGLRADNPRAAATVLLTDAAHDVWKIAAATFREQAVTPSTRQRLREVIDMLTDAERLSAICEDEPSLGTVTIQADGTQTWEAAPH